MSCISYPTKEEVAATKNFTPKTPMQLLSSPAMLGAMGLGGIVFGFIGHKKFGSTKATLIGALLGGVTGGLIYWASSNAIGKAQAPYEIPEAITDGRTGQIIGYAPQF